MAVPNVFQVILLQENHVRSHLPVLPLLVLLPAIHPVIQEMGIVIVRERKILVRPVTPPLANARHRLLVTQPARKILIVTEMQRKMAVLVASEENAPDLLLEVRQSLPPPPASTPGPTTPPAACNTSCSKDSQCAGAKDGCTVCGSGGKCAPAPTPTPAFNENWCTCDGLDTNPASFFPGDSVSFISYGKVEAPYLDRAKVESMTFYVYRGDATTATRIADSGAIPASLDSQSSAKDRYKSTWSYKIPTDITKDEIFRVQSKIKCVAQNVLGASIKYEPTLIDRVVSFVGYLFGFRSQPAAMDYAATPVPTRSTMANAVPTSQVLAAQNSLQIDTFTPAKIIEKSCSIIRFKFGD